MPSLAVLVPTLGRPHALAPVASAFERTAPGCRVLFILDGHDQPSRLEAERRGLETIACDGGYPVKINAGAAATDEELLLCAADDVRPHPGWLEAALEHVDAGAGVVGTNPLHGKRTVRGEFSPHPLVTRAYVDEHGTADEPGLVMHPGYRHNCCDVELAETAQARDLWTFAADSIVEHLHPRFTDVPTDATYERSDRTRARDRALLAERRSLWQR